MTYNVFGGILNLTQSIIAFLDRDYKLPYSRFHSLTTVKYGHHFDLQCWLPGCDTAHSQSVLHYNNNYIITTLTCMHTYISLTDSFQAKLG